MSELRIALIAEGPTDLIIIESALKAILNRSFILNLLQPEPTRPEMGGGWGGVFKWCNTFRQKGYLSFQDDPTLELFDLIIIHLDADVAEKSYSDCGEAVAQVATSLPVLPCSLPCPPPSDTVNQLRSLLLAWLGFNSNCPKTVFCIPSKASDAWLASALLPVDHQLLNSIECNLNLENDLSQLPKSLRIRKSTREYRSYASTITTHWGRVCDLCSQANAFHENITTVAAVAFSA